MAKHRLGQSDGPQWGGPDLVTGTATPSEPERVDTAAELPEEE